jgi:hypothetical protein
MGMTADVKVITTPSADQVLLLSVCSADQLAQWASGSTAVAKVVPGLGDAAFAGPQGGSEANVIAFRKGPRAIRVVSSLSPSDADYVPEAKLMELAKLVESRMP